MVSSRASLLMIGCLWLVAGAARADGETTPRSSIGYENLFAVRVNPLGLGDELKLRYRYGLYESPRPVLAQNFVGVVTPILLAPSFVRFGLGVELQPLSVLHLYAGYEPAYYFGAVDRVLPLSSIAAHVVAWSSAREAASR